MTSRGRVLAVTLGAVAVLGLAACSEPSPPVPSATPSPASASASGLPTPTTSPQPVLTASPAAQPAPSGSAEPGTADPGTKEPTSKPTKPSSPSKPSKPSTPDKPSKPQASGARWKPPAKVTWQWQLSGSLDTSVNVKVYDVDLFDTSASQVKKLHADGRKVICYFSAGSYESGRPDSGDFPAAVKGKKMDGWPENWLDIRDPRVLDIMAARMDLCAKKGFDGVEPDNVDGYQNDTGFSLSAKDQLAFNKAIAKLAHDRGLAVGLKNDLDQVAALQPSFDFAVNEECFEWDECQMLTPFIKAGKPVLHVEYGVAPGTFCPTTTSLGFSSMRKNMDLDAARTPCPS